MLMLKVNVVKCILILNKAFAPRVNMQLDSVASVTLQSHSGGRMTVFTTVFSIQRNLCLGKITKEIIVQCEI